MARYLLIKHYRGAPAIEIAGALSAAPGAGGEPIYEWLEVRPFLAHPEPVEG